MIIGDLIDANKIEKKKSETFKNLFFEKWPSVADKIVAYSKKSGVNEVKQFWRDNSQWKEDTPPEYKQSLALFLLPLLIKVTKLRVTGNQEPVPVMKKEISEGFIPVIQVRATKN